MSAAKRQLSAAERLDWLRLIRSENVGPVTFYQLLDHFGSPRDALAALPDFARKGGRARPLKICAKDIAERELEALQRIGGRLVAWGEPEYPPALASVEDAPPVLSMIGQPQLVGRHAVAIVGARNASANGRRLARDLAAALGEHGLLVVSGLARGIDAAAHQGSLATGTLAVLAGGVDQIYPEENRALHEQIAERGLLVAEVPVGTEPQARHFPRRNRIISGASRGVLVVEAAEKSGSLITARFALEQGREVFAVPGSPLDPRSKGTNRLLREGATLVETVDDILRELQPQLQRQLAEPPREQFSAPPVAKIAEPEIDAARRAVLELLSPSPLAVDELVRQCQFSPPIVLTVILELELAGRVERQPGNTLTLL